MTCSRDTNGDGNCGRPACPECGPERFRPMSLREAALATLRGQSWSDGHGGRTPGGGTLTGEQVIAVYRAIELADRGGVSAEILRVLLIDLFPGARDLSDRRIDKSLQKLKRMKLIRFDRAKRCWTTEGGGK